MLFFMVRVCCQLLLASNVSSSCPRYNRSTSPMHSLCRWHTHTHTHTQQQHTHQILGACFWCLHKSVLCNIDPFWSVLIDCTWIYSLSFPAECLIHWMVTYYDHTVQTLYHRAKISFFALRGDCAHEKYLFILGVRDWKTGIFGVFWSLSGKNLCAGLV